MEKDVFDLTLKRIKEEEIDVGKFMLLLNGEPLIDPDLFLRIKQIKEQFSESIVEFTSNFALADTDKINGIFEFGLDSIIISLNSTDPDEYRDLMRLDYYKTCSNIQMLISEKKKRSGNLRIRISAVVQNGDMREIERMQQEWGEDVDIRPIFMGKWISHEELYNNSETLRNDGNRYAKTFGICASLIKSIYFLSNGDYALCCFDPEGIIGLNVNDTKIRDYLKSKQLNKIKRVQFLMGTINKECLGCSFMQENS